MSNASECTFVRSVLVDVPSATSSGSPAHPRVQPRSNLSWSLAKTGRTTYYVAHGKHGVTNESFPNDHIISHTSLRTDEFNNSDLGGGRAVFDQLQ